MFGFRKKNSLSKRRGFRSFSDGRSRSHRSISLKNAFRVIALLILIFSIGGGSFLYYWFHRGLPQLDGKITLSFLDQQVQITRDENGIVAIKANSDLDGYRALGFVHAQDRFFQMDLMRHAGSGRLSEWFGNRTVATDRFMRLMQLRKIAEENFQSLTPETKAAFVAYSQGVNAIITNPNYKKPPEYLLLPSGKIEAWSPIDSMLWGKLMAVTLSGNMRSEIRRARLQAGLEESHYKSLFDDLGTNDYISLASNNAASPAAPASTMANSITANKPMDNQPQTLVALAQELLPIYDILSQILPPTAANGGASNEWILAPSRTDTGAPILANDPHLELGAPGSWYLVQIDTPTRHLVGATAPGIPFIVLGRNESIAWGMTTTGTDTQDLFVERFTNGKPGYYDTPRGSEPIISREEVIKIHREKSQIFTIRATRHGPIVSDLLPGVKRMINNDLAISLAATMLNPSDHTADALYRLERASNWDSFRAAVSNFGSPPHNIAYADRNGHIGIVGAGNIPIRKSGNGLLPTAGWSGESDWIGFVAVEKLPYRYDPPSGVLVNANNRLVGPDYPYLLTHEWAQDYRSRRIAEKLASQPRHSIADMIALQNDIESIAAREILPRLLAAAPSPNTPIFGEVEFAKRLLLAWNHRMEADRPEPLIFAAIMRHLQIRLFAPALQILGPKPGELLEDSDTWTPDFNTVARIIANDSVWCNSDPTSNQPVSCDDMINKAFETAIEDLRTDFGEDPLKWKWGDVHNVTLEHPLFKHVPIIKNLVTQTVPSNGGWDTIRMFLYPRPSERLDWSKAPFESNYGSDYRAIYDLSHKLSVRMIATPGNSGHPWSPYFDKLLGHWSWGELITYSRDGETDAKVIQHQLTLMP